jgi:phosphate transport system substrate-binding protein
MKINRILTGFFVAISVISCNSGNSGSLDETPTRGNIKITADESAQLLIDAQLYTFQSLYTDAIIKPQYKPEIDVINDLMNDSVRTVVSCRKLTEKEEKILISQSFYPRTTKIAYDAIALIINKANPDSMLKYSVVNDIFTGKARKWKDIDPKSKLGDIQIVFDNPKSANARYMKEKFALDHIPEYWSAVNSNQEIVDFIEKNPSSIGLISVNWISDPQDTVTRGFLKKITVIGISPSYEAQVSNYYQPYQAYIADKSYPLIREVYTICRESFSGLGSGFIQFIAGEKGQRIVLKSGIVPATMPIRLVHLSNNLN